MKLNTIKKKSDLLLKKAKSLMEIDRTRYISSLPLFTISDELLIKYSYFFYTFYIL